MAEGAGRPGMLHVLHACAFVNFHARLRTVRIAARRSLACIVKCRVPGRQPGRVGRNDLDWICATRGCAVADLTQAESVPDAGADTIADAAGGERAAQCARIHARE
jgi:hypothetical protein